jgi:hypothetical protein
MSTDIHRPSARGSALGYTMVLLGAVLFVTSCFLPYYGFPRPPAGRTISLYQLLTLEPSPASSDLAALLYLFGGVTSVAATAIIALGRGRPRPGAPYLLVGAIVAWSLTWIGVLLRSIDRTPLNMAATFGPTSLEVGVWLQAVSIGVAVIGTILVWFDKRSEVKDSHDRYANKEGVDPDA